MVYLAPNEAADFTTQHAPAETGTRVDTANLLAMPLFLSGNQVIILFSVIS